MQQYKLRDKLFLVFPLIAICLTAWEFIDNRSLWLDEAFLSLNISERSFIGLMHPLNDGQICPILFLWIEKFFLVIFKHDWALRIFPLLSYWVSIAMFYKLATALFQEIRIARVALAIFCCLPFLFSYAIEVKQYGTDVLVFVSLMHLFIRAIQATGNQRAAFVKLAVAGVLAIFISQISIILIATVCLYMLYLVVYKKQLDKKYLLIIGIWGFFFIANYIIFLTHQPYQGFMLFAWNEYFMPLNIFSSKFFVFVLAVTQNVFKMLLGLEKLWLAGLALFLFAIVNLLYRKKYFIVFLLVTPVLLHLAISSLKLYPFYHRFILYLLPTFILLIAYAMNYAFEVLRKYIKWAPAVLLYLPALYILNHNFWSFRGFPPQKEEIKAVIKYLNENTDSSQTVYITHPSMYAFKFYEENGYVHLKAPVVFANATFVDILNYQQLNNLHGKVWVIFSHIIEDEEKNFVGTYTQNNRIIGSFKAFGTVAYLLQL